MTKEGIKSIVRQSTRTARAEERQRYTERRKNGDLRVPPRIMGYQERIMALMLHPLSARKSVESIVHDRVDQINSSSNSVNLVGSSLQRIHDRALNPEGYTSFAERAVEMIEHLGVLPRIFLEGIPGVDDIIDITLEGAKLLSPDSWRSKLVGAADIVLDDIPLHGLVFPAGLREEARDRVDEESDLAALKSVRVLIASQDPSAKRLAGSVVQAFEQSHPYHERVHKVLSSTQDKLKPVASKYRETHQNGSKRGVDIHVLGAELLKAIGGDPNKIDAKSLADAGDRLHKFATVELKRPGPMIDYVREVIAIADKAADERRQEAKAVTGPMKSLRRSNRKKARQLEITAVKWQQAKQIGTELLQIYEAAKQVAA